MVDLLDFRDSLIAYLLHQKELEQRDINNNKLLSDSQKIESGLLIKDAVVIGINNQTYELDTDEDNTKLKIGDIVTIRLATDYCRAKVTDLGLDSIFIETSLPLKLNDKINIEILESVYLDPLISLLQLMDDGKPGASFLKQLAGLEVPTDHNIGGIRTEQALCIPDFLNEKQLEVIEGALKRPSTYCIQGPPGTGKTAVLATIANCFAERNKDVLIVSNTHQAVNNALTKVAELFDETNPIKIGEALKAESLHKNIILQETFSDFLKERKVTNKKRINGDIVGMTLHSAIINLGLRNTGFQPQIVLVDEAGQMPMPYASIIGTFGSGSIIFIGDDKQMPPIFHPNLVNNKFSQSIFSYLCNQYPFLRKTLNVTYRMNEEITEYVSTKFYECHDEQQKIISSNFSKGRRFPIQIRTNEEFTVLEALSSDISIYICDITPNQDCLESNPYEAEFAFKLAKAAINNGMSASDIAIVTPFRKQVKMIRSVFHQEGWNMDKTPLINTVECLQGQDVEMIIISFSATNPIYINQHYQFIMDNHRINVMVSRAKTKVVMMKSKGLI